MGLNRILDLLGLPTLAHQDSCMQLFYCWVCTCCFMTLDPGPLWLSKSFFRLASDLCLGKERMEMSQSLCPALVLLWCYNMAYNFSDNPSLDIASLSMVHALSKSRIFSVFHENTMWHHFPACSGICNECQLSLSVKVACGALMRGSETWHISMLFPQLLFKNNLHIYTLILQLELTVNLTESVIFYPFQIILGLNLVIRMFCNHGFSKQYSIANVMWDVLGPLK